MTNSMIKDAFTCASKGNDGRDEMWQPYFEEIAKQTIDAAKHSNLVVLTHATYRQTQREFCVNKTH
jgi:hypothetical protein